VHGTPAPSNSTRPKAALKAGSSRCGDRCCCTLLWAEGAHDSQSCTTVQATLTLCIHCGLCCLPGLVQLQSGMEGSQHVTGVQGSEHDNGWSKVACWQQHNPPQPLEQPHVLTSQQSRNDGCFDTSPQRVHKRASPCYTYLFCVHLAC
jgi:hypothetical protein